MSVTYYTIPSPEHLANYVQFFWVLESDTPYVHRQVADISPELIFHYRGRFDELTVKGSKTPSFLAGIHGQSGTISRFTINESFGIFGAYLYPYAIPALFGIPASELTGMMPDLETIWGTVGSRLEEKMITAPDNRKRVRILTHFLSEKLRSAVSGSPAIFRSIKYIMETRGTLKVRSVASKFCLSERQFERKFKLYAGFSPKLFSRITRFHAATKYYNAGAGKTLTQIAHDCGYYDQSHFIQDFKEFSGHLPGAFFSGNAEGTEWRE